MFYIYILYSSSCDKYYVGHTSDPQRRYEQHNGNSGDKYTGKYRDWELKAVFEVSDQRGEALRLEKFIKRQKSRLFLEKLIAPNFIPSGELAQLVRVPKLRD